MSLRLLDLFSGIGGFSLGLERTGGFETVAFCEIEPYPRRVLATHWPEVPCYDDVRTLTADRLATDGITVDAICAGFPCQDLSYAGKRAGIEGARSGLWSEVARLTGELRPQVLMLENVTAILDGGLGRVLGDLAAIGYDAFWDCIPASALGAPHQRDRWALLAYPSCDGRAVCWAGSIGRGAPAPVGECRRPQSGRVCAGADARHGADPDRAGREEQHVAALATRPRLNSRLADPQRLFWAAEPCPEPVADGVPEVVARLKAVGNSIVPQWAYLVGIAALAALDAKDAERAVA